MKFGLKSVATIPLNVVDCLCHAELLIQHFLHYASLRKGEVKTHALSTFPAKDLLTCFINTSSEKPFDIKPCFALQSDLKK